MSENSLNNEFGGSLAQIMITAQPITVSIPQPGGASNPIRQNFPQMSQPITVGIAEFFVGGLGLGEFFDGGLGLGGDNSLGN